MWRIGIGAVQVIAVGAGTAVLLIGVMSAETGWMVGFGRAALARLDGIVIKPIARLSDTLQFSEQVPE